MPTIATRLHSIKPSPTLQMTKEVNRLRREGVDVIGLAAGEPDFDTPDFIKAAAIKAIEEGKTKYTSVDGISDLREAVALRFRQRYGVDCASDQVIVGCGAKHILFNALLASLNEGDEVIIPAPYWVSYPDMVRLAGGKPVIVPCGAAQGFKLTTDALRAALTPRSKWLIVNSPSNPTGAIYSHEELASLLAVVREHSSVCVLSDEIYEGIIYDDAPFASCAAVARDVSEELIERVLVVNGVSKAYAMTGWRIGYGVGSAELIKGMAKIQSQSTSNACSVSQYAALAALTGDDGFMAARTAAFSARRDRVVTALNDMAGIECDVPRGAFYVFPSCAGVLGKKDGGDVIASSLDFASYLLRAARVAVVAGEAFGMDGHIRISYATDDDSLKTAMKRIADAVAQLR